MDYIKIGSVIGGYTVIAMTQRAVMATASGAPEPYVCWLLNPDGRGVDHGKYCTDRMDCEWSFAARSFDWFEDNVIINFKED